MRDAVCSVQLNSVPSLVLAAIHGGVPGLGFPRIVEPGIRSLILYVPYIWLFTAMQLYFWWLPYFFGGASPSRRRMQESNLDGVARCLPRNPCRPHTVVPSLEHSLLIPIALATGAIGTAAFLETTEGPEGGRALSRREVASLVLMSLALVGQPLLGALMSVRRACLEAAHARHLRRRVNYARSLATGVVAGRGSASDSEGDVGKDGNGASSGMRRRRTDAREQDPADGGSEDAQQIGGGEGGKDRAETLQNGRVVVPADAPLLSPSEAIPSEDEVERAGSTHWAGHMDWPFLILLPIELYATIWLWVRLRTRVDATIAELLTPSFWQSAAQGV